MARLVVFMLLFFALGTLGVFNLVTRAAGTCPYVQGHCLSPEGFDAQEYREYVHGLIQRNWHTNGKVAKDVPIVKCQVNPAQTSVLDGSCACATAHMSPAPAVISFPVHHLRLPAPVTTHTALQVFAPGSSYVSMKAFSKVRTRTFSKAFTRASTTVTSSGSIQDAVEDTQNVTLAMFTPGTGHQLLPQMDPNPDDFPPFRQFSCGLQPEAHSNPFYFGNELVRTNVTDTEEGVPLFMTFQIKNVSNCKPVANTYVEIWHANATGYFSGTAPRPALGTFPKNPSPVTSAVTALRGLYPTDENGIVTFETIYPGPAYDELYVPTQPYISFIVHRRTKETDSTGLAVPPAPIVMNSTDTSFISVVHSGQVFFEPKLNALIAGMPPYTENPIKPGSSATDANYAAEIGSGHDENGHPLDPVAWYRFQSGIWAFVGVGVDPEAQYRVPVWGTRA